MSSENLSSRHGRENQAALTCLRDQRCYTRPISRACVPRRHHHSQADLVDNERERVHERGDVYDHVKPIWNAAGRMKLTHDRCRPPVENLQTLVRRVSENPDEVHLCRERSARTASDLDGPAGVRGDAHHEGHDRDRYPARARRDGRRVAHRIVRPVIGLCCKHERCQRIPLSMVGTRSLMRRRPTHREDEQAGHSADGGQRRRVPVHDRDPVLLAQREAAESCDPIDDASCL